MEALMTMIKSESMEALMTMSMACMIRVSSPSPIPARSGVKAIKISDWPHVHDLECKRGATTIALRMTRSKRSAKGAEDV
eukprot:scaffold211748_cov14-Tisochrysis_lutea.AAC.1